MTDETPKRPKRLTLLFIVLPLWLVASGALVVWFYLDREQKEAQAKHLRFAQTVSVPGLADDLRKLVETIGERHGSSETASVLFEMGLPAVRVATRPVVLADKPDNTLPSPAVVAASTGRLVELIRRCAGLR